MQTALLLALGCGAALLSVAAADEYDHKVRGCRGGGGGAADLRQRQRGARRARAQKKERVASAPRYTPLVADWPVVARWEVTGL